ncbi:hypothetical protein IWW34DRAFT_771887, partial [Fusarium oxysporum f. sp. albedinis]
CYPICSIRIYSLFLRVVLVALDCWRSFFFFFFFFFLRIAVLSARPREGNSLSVPRRTRPGFIALSIISAKLIGSASRVKG